MSSQILTCQSVNLFLRHHHHHRGVAFINMRKKLYRQYSQRLWLPYGSFPPLCSLARTYSKMKRNNHSMREHVKYNVRKMFSQFSLLFSSSYYLHFDSYGTLFSCAWVFIGFAPILLCVEKLRALLWKFCISIETREEADRV